MSAGAHILQKDAGGGSLSTRRQVKATWAVHVDNTEKRRKWMLESDDLNDGLSDRKKGDVRRQL